MTQPEGSFTTVRAAGLLERYHITRCELGLDTCVSVSARYYCRGGVSLEQATVLSALRQVVSTHPALCVRVDARPGEVPYFVRLSSIDMRDVMTYSDDPAQSLEDVLALQLGIPFDTKSNLPLWRLVIHGGNMIFSYHHGLGDGQSGAAFHHALRAALNNLPTQQDGASSPVLTISPDILIDYPIEQLTDISVSLRTFCAVMYNTFAPSSWTSGYRAWTGNDVSSVAHLHTNVRLRRIDPNAANTLLDTCRRHNCTLTSFLHTLAVRVLSHVVTRRYPKSMGERNKTFSTAIPISLRRFTGISPFKIVDHASTYNSHVPIERPAGDNPLTQGSFPWKDASALHKDMLRNLEKSREVIGTLRYVHLLGMSESFFLGHLGKKRNTTFELSNIGPMPKSEHADEGNASSARWEVDDVYFGQNNPVLGAAIKMNVAGSPSGSINIEYTWAREAIDNELVESFIAEVHEAITLFCSMRRTINERFISI